MLSMMESGVEMGKEEKICRNDQRNGQINLRDFKS